MQAANFCSKHGGGWAFPWRNRGKQKDPPSAWYLDQDLRSRRFTKEVAATKKNPKHFTHLGVGSLLPQKSGFFSWAAGVGGMGRRPARPDKAASSNAPNLFNASCWNAAGHGAIRGGSRRVVRARSYDSFVTSQPVRRVTTRSASLAQG